MKSYYNTACDNWMISHPGRPLTIYDLAGCLGSAYPNAMTPRNIQKSFSITGIFPFNPDIFTDDEYLSSFVTDRENTETRVIENVVTSPTSSPSILHDQILNDVSVPSVSDKEPPQLAPPAPNAEIAAPVAQIPPSNDDVTPDISNNEKENDCTILRYSKLVSQILPSTSNSRPLEISDNDNRVNETASLQMIDNDRSKTPTCYDNILVAIPSTTTFVSPEVIRPHPKAGPRKGAGKGRKQGRTRILTDTPEKLEIQKEWEARKQKKEKKIRKVKAKVVKRNLNSQKQEQTTSEDEELPPSPESDLSILEENDISISESDNEDESIVSVVSGDWAVLNLVSEKNLVHRYVGQILRQNRAGYDVKFAKKINDTIFKWPIKEDIAAIAKYQVVKKLPPPKIKSSSRRIISFEFPKSLRNLKISK